MNYHFYFHIRSYLLLLLAFFSPLKSIADEDGVERYYISETPTIIVQHPESKSTLIGKFNYSATISRFENNLRLFLSPKIEQLPQFSLGQNQYKILNLQVDDGSIQLELFALPSDTVKQLKNANDEDYQKITDTIVSELGWRGELFDRLTAESQWLYNQREDLNQKLQEVKNTLEMQNLEKQEELKNKIFFTQEELKKNKNRFDEINTQLEPLSKEIDLIMKSFTPQRDEIPKKLADQLDKLNQNSNRIELTQIGVDLSNLKENSNSNKASGEKENPEKIIELPTKKFGATLKTHEEAFQIKLKFRAMVTAKNEETNQIHFFNVSSTHQHTLYRFPFRKISSSDYETLRSFDSNPEAQIESNLKTLPSAIDLSSFCIQHQELNNAPDHLINSTFVKFVEEFTEKIKVELYGPMDINPITQNCFTLTIREPSSGTPLANIDIFAKIRDYGDKYIPHLSQRKLLGKTDQNGNLISTSGKNYHCFSDKETEAMDMTFRQNIYAEQKYRAILGQSPLSEAEIRQKLDWILLLEIDTGPTGLHQQFRLKRAPASQIQKSSEWHQKAKEKLNQDYQQALASSMQEVQEKLKELNGRIQSMRTELQKIAIALPSLRKKLLKKNSKNQIIHTRIR